MPQISAAEYSALPLRVHSFLAGVPLHDVWAVDLPPSRERVSLADFNPVEHRDTRAGRPPVSTRALVTLRLFLGRIFRLEDEPKDAATTSFTARLTPEDRARSSLAAGTANGSFRAVYRFENESLREIHNRTVHAAALTALARTADGGYRFYFAVYVAKGSWITPFYMALIDPFRRWLIYPALLNTIRTSWLERFAVSAP